MDPAGQRLGAGWNDLHNCICKRFQHMRAGKIVGNPECIKCWRQPEVCHPCARACTMRGFALVLVLSFLPFAYPNLYYLQGSIVCGHVCVAMIKELVSKDTPEPGFGTWANGVIPEAALQVSCGPIP